MDIHSFAEVTYRVLQDTPLFKYIPTLRLPRRGEIQALQGVPSEEEERMRDIALSWAQSTARDDDKLPRRISRRRRIFSDHSQSKWRITGSALSREKTCLKRHQRQIMALAFSSRVAGLLKKCTAELTRTGFKRDN